MEINPKIPIKQRLFIYDYIKHGDGKRAAIVAEYKNPAQAAANLLNPKSHPLVVEQIELMMLELEVKAELTAEYVRQYLFDILDFKPTEHFKPAGGGGWTIDEDSYNQLPEKIKRLIEDVQYQTLTIRTGDNQRTQTKLLVRFISKTTAMVTAAKYTLSQKLLIAGESSIDFDELQKRVAAKRASRTIESKIEEMKMQALPPISKPSTNGVNGDHK